MLDEFLMGLDGINSSKVYCKYLSFIEQIEDTCVLIVAKCIVNENDENNKAEIYNVLIVAKCIVNTTINYKINNEKGVLIVAKCIVNGEYNVLLQAVQKY